MTPGQRYLAACKALGVEPWRTGMRLSSGDIVVIVGPGWLLACDDNGYSGADARWSALPDLYDAATLGAAMEVYEELRDTAQPNAVLLRLADPAVGWGTERAQEVLVSELEKLAAARVGGAP